jgi:pimeloyl-ACP methyl ester carboxylesterase
MSRQPDWRAPELGERKQIETSHGPIAYHDAGAGPPLVLVHGFLANANIWRKLISLIEKDFRWFLRRHTRLRRKARATMRVLQRRLGLLRHFPPPQVIERRPREDPA